MEMGAKVGAKRSIGVAVALVLLAIIPHWRTVILSELPLPEGYLVLLAPELKPHLRQTPWNALWWDGIGQFWAWRTEAMRQVHYGRIPLWTNRIGCGFPFLANPQTQSLYPPTLVGTCLVNGLCKNLPIPIRSAKLMGWLAFFHTLLALVGAYLLIRSYGISRLSSLVGAAACGLASFHVAWALLPTLPATAAWLPLTVWLLRKLAAAVAGSDLKTATYFGIGFSVSLAMTLLAGHSQIAIYSLLALLLFASLEIVPAYRRAKSLALFAFALPFALSFLLAAGQLLPTMELAPFTHRHGAPTWEGYKGFAQRGLTIFDWATVAVPFLFGNPVDGSYFGKESFADYCAYTGFGVSVLAVWGFLWFVGTSAIPNLRRRLRPLPLAPLHALSLFLLGALLASGSVFNLPFYFLLPGFSQIGTPSRAVFLCQLALGLTAAWVLEREAGDERERKWQAVGAIAVALVAVAFAIGCVGWWLGNNLPNFSWSGWVSLLTEQNLGVVAGLSATAVFALRKFLGLQSPVLRYSVAALLIGELLWFSAQQIPTARVPTVQQALRAAEHRLSQLVKQVTNPKSQTPVRLLFIGGDWSLVRYPQSLLPPNSVLLFLRAQVADARNYDSLLLRRHKAVLALFSNGNPCPLENGNLILLPERQTSLWDAKKLAQIVGAEAVVEAFGGSLRVVETFSVRGNLREFLKTQRAFVPAKVQYVKTADEAIGKLAQCPEGTALLVARPKKHFGGFGERALVTLDKDAFVKVEAMPSEAYRKIRPVWLVLSDTAYPGWRAFTRRSGYHYSSWRQLPTAVANGAFRACHLPDILDDVVWVYFPSSFAVGLFLSFVGVFGVAAVGFGALPDLFAESLRRSRK